MRYIGKETQLDFRHLLFNSNTCTQLIYIQQYIYGCRYHEKNQKYIENAGPYRLIESRLNYQSQTSDIVHPDTVTVCFPEPEPPIINCNDIVFPLSFCLCFLSDTKAFPPGCIPDSHFFPVFRHGPPRQRDPRFRQFF